MKHYVYLDNFRGFTDTYIPITDVNFLVGENSTGKSSILELIKLLSDTSFLMGKQDFSEGTNGFGHYLDMVSVHSDHQEFFRVGYVSETVRRDDRVVRGCLLTFVEERGQPRMSTCTISRNKDVMTFRRGGKDEYRYAASKYNGESTADSLIKTLRTEWVEMHRNSELQTLRIPVRGLDGWIPLVYLMHVAGSAEKAPSDLLDEPPSPFLLSEMARFSPIRARPKRTYDNPSVDFSSDGDHTAYVIREYLNSDSHREKWNAAFEDLGTESGLFQNVAIKDFGAKDEPIPRFELDVIIDGKPLNIINVGYGVSQSLPIIVEMIRRDRGTWFAIQQPEVHLHPRAQAALGGMFYEMASLDSKHFLIETHSDFIIDRFRMKYRAPSTKKPDGQVLFFERHNKRNIVTPIRISDTGDLSADQPSSYRQFFVREQMEMLGL